MCVMSVTFVQDLPETTSIVNPHYCFHLSRDSNGGQSVLRWLCTTRIVPKCRFLYCHSYAIGGTAASHRPTDLRTLSDFRTLPAASSTQHLLTSASKTHSQSHAKKSTSVSKKPTSSQVQSRISQMTGFRMAKPGLEPNQGLEVKSATQAPFANTGPNHPNASDDAMHRSGPSGQAPTTLVSLMTSFETVMTDADTTLLNDSDNDTMVTPFTSFGSNLSESGPDASEAQDVTMNESMDGQDLLYTIPQDHNLDQRLEPLRIKSLPVRGFFQTDAPLGYGPNSFRAKHECTRIAIASGVQTQDIYELMPAEVDSLCEIHTIIRNHPKFKLPRHMSSNRAWDAAFRRHDDFRGSAMRASLTWNKNLIGDLFKFDLKPFDLGLPCRLERKFGWDRFLYVDILGIESGQQGADTNQYLRPRLMQWLGTEHSLVGRRWRAFDLKDRKTSKHLKAGSTKEFGYTVAFFAVEGSGIKSESLESFVNWLIPLHNNMKSSFCKVAARLALGRQQKSALYHLLN